MLQNVCSDFRIGAYQSHEVVPLGYEDFNLAVTTDTGKYFVKIFASFRDEEECQRYVDIIERALRAGVSHPKLYKSDRGFLYGTQMKDVDRLIVMEYIDGKTYYERHTNPTRDEIAVIVKQAALINGIDLKPPFVYDHWAITSLLREYGEKGKYLSGTDARNIEPLVNTFRSLSLKDLPHCLVHGDITKTNTMKNRKGNIYILDFAVANRYPRIQDLAVLLCDLFFDPDSVDDFPKTYDFVLSEYRKHVPLTPEEIQLLPVYVKFAHVMHVLLASYEKKVRGNDSPENEYFLGMGRRGLTYTSALWP